MKRLTLLTILLVVVGLASGFGLELKPGFTLTANAKLSWGIDLDTMHTGFKNAETIDAYVWFFKDETTDTHQGEGDWYGVIKVKDLELFWYTNEAKYFANSDTLITGWTYAAVGVSDLANEDPELEAKIVGLGGDLAIGVYSDPDLGSNVDFVASLESDDKVDNDKDYYTLDDETTVEADLGLDFSGPGTYVSYALSDALLLALEVVSNNDWTVDDSDAYAFAIDVQYKVAMLTINAGVNYGLYYPYNYPVGFGLKVAADTDMIDGWVGFDGEYNSAWTDAFEYEFGGGVTFTLFEVTTAAVAATFGTGDTVVGFDDFDLSVKFTEPAAKGLVDNLDLSIEVYLLDLLDPAPAATDAAEYEIIVDGGYLYGVFYPNVKVDFGNDVNTGSTAVALNGEFFYLTVGVDITVIPLTIFGVYYTSGDLWQTDALMGTIVFSAKVTY